MSKTIQRIQKIAGEVFVAIEQLGLAIENVFEAINNGLVVFGDIIYEGLSAVLKFIDNLFSGLISIQWPYGIWVDITSTYENSLDCAGESTCEYTKPLIENKPYNLDLIFRKKLLFQ